MKKSVFILAMLLMAATAFTQTSRRTANSQKPASEKQEKTTKTSSNQKTAKESTFNRRSSATQNNNSQTTSGRRTVTREQRQTTGTTVRSNENRSSVTTRRSATVNTGNRPAGNTATANQSHPRNGDRQVYRSGRQGTAGSSTKYVTYYESPRLYRSTRVVSYHYTTPPRSRYYRARHFPYRVPVHIDIYWTAAMRANYVRYYPMVTTWRYPVGYRIQSISAYDAVLYRGEVMSVYGQVTEVFYSRETDEYFLYFGAYYPYHDMSVVIPGWIARDMSRWPEKYFEQQHVMVTGLISTYDDKPEIAIRDIGQISIY